MIRQRRAGEKRHAVLHEMGTSEFALNQHHVGGRRADHGPKHAPGVIADEGRSEKGDKGRLPQPVRTSAGESSRPKGLDRDIPVTEVWSLRGTP